MDQVAQIIAEAAKVAVQETADAPPPAFAGAVEWPVEASLGKGLEGAVACESEIGYVDGTKGWLIYGGLNVFDLAEKSTYEESAYVTLNGKLPTQAELDDFNAKLLANRAVPDEVIATLARLPKDTHPMAALRTGVSVLGCLDPGADETSVEAEMEISIKLIAQLATIAGAVAMIRKGKDPVAPDPALGHSANYLYMSTGEKPDELLARIMDVALILHIDHGMNASTFTTMVVNSSLSDMYSSVVAGIGSLKGPLHGGANERVMYDLNDIGSPDNVEPWYRKAREEKRLIMGFGHRVYKAYDPRARILKPLSALMAEADPEMDKLYNIAIKLDDLVCAELGAEKGIFPNVDFYSGIVYTGLGFETAMFTPIFAVSRVAGWCARALEYLADNRIFRPRAAYIGPMTAEYVPMDQR
ncbi:MAG: citrate synthase/methylcitrate synthase [Armatimonadota bacterium]|jgi:citrate synthase